MSTTEGYESSVAETCPGAFDSSPCSARTLPPEVPPLHCSSARTRGLSPYYNNSSSHEFLIKHVRQHGNQYHSARSSDHADLNGSLDDITPRSLEDEWSETSPPVYCFRRQEDSGFHASPLDIPIPSERLSVCNLSLDLIEEDAVFDSTVQSCDSNPPDNGHCSRVTAAVRIRPFTKQEMALNATPALTAEDNQVIISAHLTQAPHLVGRKFYFDHVFWSSSSNSPDSYCPPATQEAVFETLGLPAINNVIQGFNTCLICYGQTGSGKTYTMTGPSHDPGIIPCCAAAIFDHLEEPQTTKRLGMYTVQMSYIEIYKEKVYDLLTDGQYTPRKKSRAVNDGPNLQRSNLKLPNDMSATPRRTHQQSLKVREHPLRGASVEGLSQHVVHSGADIMSFVKYGNEMRSSGSHAIVTIEIAQQSLMLEGREQVYSSKISRLHLVDLAGSERMYSSKAQEMTSTSLSLCTLSRVIEILSKNSVHQLPPYRDSPLTWLLVDAFGGNSKTTFIATVSPAVSNLQETIATLHHATRVRRIMNRPLINEDPRGVLIAALQQEGQALRKHLMQLTSRSLSPVPHTHQLQKDMESLEQLIKELKQHGECERRQWQSKLQKLFAQQETHNAVCQVMRHTQEDLERQLEEAGRHVQRLMEEVVTLQQALADRESDVAQLAAEKWRLRSILESKGLEASKQQQQLETLRHELKRSHIQMAEMAAQLQAQETPSHSKPIASQLQEVLRAHLQREDSELDILATLSTLKFFLFPVPPLLDQLTAILAENGAKMMACERIHATEKEELAHKLQTMEKRLADETSGLQAKLYALEHHIEALNTLLQMKTRCTEEQANHNTTELLSKDRQWEEEREALLVRLRASEMRHQDEIATQREHWRKVEEGWQVEREELKSKLAIAENEVEEIAAECRRKLQSAERQWDAQRSDLQQRYQIEEQRLENKTHALQVKLHITEQNFEEERAALLGKLRNMEMQSETMVETCHLKLLNGEKQWEEERIEMRRKLQAMEQRLDDELGAYQAKLKAAEQLFKSDKMAFQPKFQNAETCPQESPQSLDHDVQEKVAECKTTMLAAEKHAKEVVSQHSTAPLSCQRQWEEEKQELQAELHALKQRYEGEISTLQAKVRAAEQYLETQRTMLQQAKVQSEVPPSSASLHQESQASECQWLKEKARLEAQVEELERQLLVPRCTAQCLAEKSQWAEERAKLQSLCHMGVGNMKCEQNLPHISADLGQQQMSTETQTTSDDLYVPMPDDLSATHPERCEKAIQTIDDFISTSSGHSSVSLENILTQLDSDDGVEVDASNAPGREMARQIMNGLCEENGLVADTHLVEAIVAEYTKLLQAAVQDRPEWKELFENVHMNIQAVSGKPTVSWLSWLNSGPSSASELAEALRRQEALSTRAAAWLAGLQAQREVMRHTVAAQVRINTKLARERTTLETEASDLRGRLERACYVLRRLHEERSDLPVLDEPILFVCPKCHEESNLLPGTEP